MTGDATAVVPLGDPQLSLPTLAEVREHVAPDNDPGQLDRMESKLDAVLADAEALREAAQPLVALASNPGGMMGLLGGLMRG